MCFSWKDCNYAKKYSLSGAIQDLGGEFESVADGFAALNVKR